MDEEATSWIWRTGFKHSFCIYHDPDMMASMPLPVQEEKTPNVKSASLSSSASMTQDHVSAPCSVKAVQNPAMGKQRSLSPSFNEERLERKRSTTPLPQRSTSTTEMKANGKVLPSNKLKGSKSIPASKCRKARTSTSPLRHLGSMRISDGPKSGKESSWAANYFDQTGVKVRAEEATDKWTADLTKLLIGQKFAHGAHSQLHHGRYNEQSVAVKIITVPDDDENGDMAATLEIEFIREVYLLSKIRHQNVIKLIAACRKPSGFFVVTEYLSGGSLRAFLHKLELEHEILPLQKTISVALDIARGMEFIHSKGVIHRDLKPENILIDENFHMKIADFGIACEEAYCDALASDPGTYRWMAPEMYKQKSYGKKVDVYSFGLILWEMISGSIPYKNMAPLPAAFAVANKNLRPDIPADCPPAMKALIEQCWSPYPHKRPEFWQIVKVLEKFQTSLSGDGTLSLLCNSICHDHRKGLLHWIHKLGPVHSPTSSSSSMPKFS